MAAPRLNVDVLAIVCEFLTDVSDVLSIALTCSSVHLVAVGWLLRMRPVYLKSDPSIRRFHSFLFADAPARAPHVCALDINLRWPIDDCSLLVEIFASCQHLKHLTVAFEQASLHIIMDPRFIHAITTIPNLRSFSLHSQSTNALGLLPRLVCTPLRKVGIHCGNVDVSARFPSALELSLPRILVPTLEKLELDRFAVDSHDPQAPPNLPLSSVFGMSVFDMTPYPAVRSLSVGSFKGRPLLDHLQHLFPAVDGTLHVGGLDIRSGEDTYADIRAANQHTQESDGDGSALRTWKKLDRIVCDAAMFYVLGLRCPIRLAMIHCGAVEKHRFAADALRENPVPRLKLTLYHESGMFDGFFSPELEGALTHLTLCLLYSNDYGYTPPHPSQSDANTAAAPPLRWDDVLVSYYVSRVSCD
ncbi:hypothetical protein LXA43DRAFT_1021914 [Ganoderma leucocontextum]|nr:hypothetical protein LXA43DRAFT_1021914 [Ganoderma leucocontextum]